MPASMALADLVHELAESIHDAARVFDASDSADFERHLRVAATAFTPFFPRTLAATLSLVADQPNYAAPADLWRFKLATWGAARSQPWEKTWPGRLPSVTECDGELWLTPPPSAHQIAVLGASYGFFYYGHHLVDADGAQTTIAAADRDLLILRAQAEAMRELAMRDTVRPMVARDGVSGQPKTGTPGYLAKLFLEEFQAEMRRRAR